MKPPAGWLLQAVRSRDLEAARRLLEQGADPNEPDPELGTVLHTAANFRDSGEMVKLLLDYNADVNAQNTVGTTPVMFAARSNKEALRFLLEKNPDLSIQDGMNRSALTWAENALNRDTAQLIREALAKPAREAEQKIIADFHQKAIENQAALRKRRVKTVLRSPQ
jgi:ankyrin repeat protein